MSESFRYSDIDLVFHPQSKTDDLQRKFDEQAVIQAVRNLILLNPFDKPFHPEIASGVTAMLFENVSPIIATLLERQIREVVQNFEPRAELVNVEVVPQSTENGYNVTVEIKVLNNPAPVNLSIVLQRQR